MYCFHNVHVPRVVVHSNWVIAYMTSWDDAMSMLHVILIKWYLDCILIVLSFFLLRKDKSSYDYVINDV